jgi:hypothetical protein
MKVLNKCVIYKRFEYITGKACRDKIVKDILMTGVAEGDDDNDIATRVVNVTWRDSVVVPFGTPRRLFGLWWEVIYA